MVRAGYVEFESERFTDTQVGVPQGGIISPLLSNLVLHELDVFVEELLKAETSQPGGSKTLLRNPLYTSVTGKISYINQKVNRGKSDMADTIRRAALIKERKKIPEYIPSGRATKLEYVRYADD